MKKIKTLTVEYKDGTTETWHGSGSSHLFKTHMKDEREHTGCYINAVLVPQESKDASKD